MADWLHIPRAGELHTQNYPLNSGKGSAYEGGVREPMIVSWPGVVAPDTKCGDYLMIEDFYPTILEIAGVQKYTTVQQRDGISFMPLLTGKGKVKDRDIYWHYPHSWDLRARVLGLPAPSAPVTGNLYITLRTVNVNCLIFRKISARKTTWL